ncbi:Glutamyl-tRNA(Gln) amidotransferase subunit A [Roseibium album]|nr:Glutamyl-tRNA(Gln) amidotransferase subunit A [Roseibium album]
MFTLSDYLQLDAAGIAAGTSAGLIKPTEIAARSLERAEAVNKELHAFTFIAHDQAIDAARRIEAGLAAGHPAGPLCGVPVAVKDLILTKGMKTTFGSRLYENYVPEQDDIVVERLRDAGAIIIGKTNVAEFGYGGVGHNPLFPTTCNPWNRELTSGGSSAGSAVAVATGVCPVALGSDGGGSVRLPASFNGIFGIKASMGRVPLWPGCRDEKLPGASGWETIEHIGPLTRTVADAALMLSVMTGPDARDRHSIPCCDINWQQAASPDPVLLRLAYCPDWGGLPLDPEVRAICNQAVDVFASEFGCEVQVTEPPFGWEIEMYRAVVAADTDIEGLKNLIQFREEYVSRGLQTFLERKWTATEFQNANIRRKAVVNAMARFMETYDLLLTPTVSCLPFSLDMDGPGTIDGRPVDDDAWTPACFPSNLTGQPSASLPAGWTKSGLPVGLQLTGRHLDDALVLQTAARFEVEKPWIDRRPMSFKA